MARDLRQVGCRRNNYPDKYTYYDSKAVDHNKLVKDAQPVGRFYGRDVIPFQWERITVNGIVSSRSQYAGTIETLDRIDIQPDMFVVNRNGKLFKVVAPVITDDENKSKVVGTRPSVKTTFKLVGML